MCALSAPHGDVNATGSFLALLIPIAAWARRTAGSLAWPAGAALGRMLPALWMTGSRTAVAAVFAAGAGALILRWARKLFGDLALVVSAGVVVVVLAAVAFPNPVFDRGNTFGAAAIRAEMGRVAIRMWRTDPLLGVGIGRFLDRSSAFIKGGRGALYGRENAHNNFLQVLAELGLLGAVAASLVLFVSLRSKPPAGLLAGVVLFLLTCLTVNSLLHP